MLRTRVKICGITQQQDALQAVELGADAIGLVFYPASKRFVEPEQARDILMGLPAFVTVVGLFVDPGQIYLGEVLDQVRLDCLQFHGSESADFCSGFDLPYIKAIRIQSISQPESEAAEYTTASGILLDSYSQTTAGGTGEVFDWEIARRFREKSTLPVILAGGLNPQNILAALKQVKPYAVDVSSGVELQAGRKDVEKMKSFIGSVYSAQP